MPVQIPVLQYLDDIPLFIGLFDITHNLVNRYVEEGCANMVHDELEYGGTYMRPWLAMVTRFVDKEGGTVYNVR